MTVKEIYNLLAPHLLTNYGPVIQSTKPVRFNSFIDELVLATGLGEEASILDCGSGFGAPAALLASKGYKVLGIEISEVLLDEARKLETHNLLFQQSSLDDLDKLPRLFDSIWMLETVGYSQDIKSLFKKCSRALKSKGSVVIKCYDVDFGTPVLTRGAKDFLGYQVHGLKKLKKLARYAGFRLEVFKDISDYEFQPQSSNIYEQVGLHDLPEFAQVPKPYYLILRLDK